MIFEWKDECELHDFQTDRCDIVRLMHLKTAWACKSTDASLLIFKRIDANLMICNRTDLSLNELDPSFILSHMLPH